jgi:hypothetical protein
MAKMRGQAIESAAPTAGLRGQAMMEYLVTYGWALLALFLVVALLIASGAFSPNSFSTQECTFQPGLPCSPYIIYKNASLGQTMLRFTLTNGLGFPINVTGINYTVTDLGEEGKRQLAGTLFQSFRVPQGGNMSFVQNFSGPRQPEPKTFKTIYVSIYYLNCKNSACSGPYQSSGRISAVVEGSP